MLYPSAPLALPAHKYDTIYCLESVNLYTMYSSTILGVQYLSSFAIVEFVVVAGLEVVGHYTIRVLLYVTCQDLLRHVVVVQFVVAHGQVDIESQHVAEDDISWEKLAI